MVDELIGHHQVREAGLDCLLVDTLVGDVLFVDAVVVGLQGYRRRAHILAQLKQFLCPVSPRNAQGIARLRTQDGARSPLRGEELSVRCLFEEPVDDRVRQLQRLFHLRRRFQREGVHGFDQKVQ